MPYMGEARNAMLKPLEEKALWLALFTAGTAEPSWKSTSSSVLEKAGHGLETGNLVLATGLTGGANSNIVSGRFYWVKKESANTVKLSQTNTFVEETWGEEISALTLTKYTEVSGAPYKRIKAEWTAPAKGLMDDNKSHSIPCAEGTKVDAVGTFSAETGGFGTATLYEIEKSNSETVLASKAYVVADTQYDTLK